MEAPHASTLAPIASRPAIRRSPLLSMGNLWRLPHRKNVVALQQPRQIGNRLPLVAEKLDVGGDRGWPASAARSPRR